MTKRENVSAKRVYRLPPCPSYDVEGMESWLTDLASRGLFLCQDGFFAGVASFERGAPHPMKYRLDAAPESTSMWSKNGGEPEEEALALSAQYGWEYVASRGEFYIYRSEEGGVRELNTDPQVQALALKTVQKRLRSSAVSCFLWAVIYPLLWLRGCLLLTMVSVGSPFFLLGAALALGMFFRSLLQVLHLRSLRKKLLAQGAIDHRKNWQKQSLRYRAVSTLFLSLTVFWLVLLLHQWSVSTLDENNTPLSEYAGDPPFATMEDLVSDPDSSYQLSALGFSNTMREWSDWLAPRAFDWNEIAEITLSDRTRLSGGLYAEYYETVSPWIARRIAEEFLLYDRLGKRYEELTLPTLPVDFAAAYSNDLHFPTIVLQKGSKVLHASFYQTSADPLPLEEWAGRMADSLQ